MKRLAVALLLWWAMPARAESARLSDAVVPTRYAITLAPNLARGTFEGRETIDVTLARPTARITLHALELDLVDARVLVGDEALEATARLDDERQTLTLLLPRELPAGTARIVLGWHASLSNDLVGFYRVRANGRHYAFTHFEPSNARRAFPCFDEPGLKARVQLTAVIDGGDEAISNAPIAAVEMLPGGDKLVQFAETPPLPPYLVALAVGKFATRQARTLDGVTVRLVATPEVLALGGFALDAAVHLLPRLGSYFARAYPFAKLDLVAVPALVPGGMENAGAIFFRDDHLLTDAATASPTELRHIELLIAHELAHQWLGDFTTARWWNDLWLQEATATFVAREILAELHPGWRAWLDFEEPLEDAFTTDELTATHPVRAPVSDGRAARAVFDGLTYTKGAAVLRMLDGWLGAGTVRRALAAYLDAHRYDVADAEDFLAALDGVAGHPAATLARAWLERAGHPLVTVAARCNDGRLTLALTQSRARLTTPPIALGTLTPAAGDDDEPWPIVVALRWPEGTRTLVFDTRSTELELAGCPAWIEANAGHAGFYRVRYSPSLAAAIATSALPSLAETERVALVSDAWADARRGAVPLSSFLSLAAALRGERSPSVLSALGQRLTFIAEELLPAPAQPRFARFVTTLLSPQYGALGWTSQTGESEDTRRLRATVIDLLGRLARAPDVLVHTARALERYLADPRALDPTLAPVVLDLAARAGGDGLYDRYLRRFKRARSPDEEQRFLASLSAFAQPSLVRRTLALLLSGAIPPQDLMTLVAAVMAQGRAASAEAWHLFTANFAALEQRSPRLGWLIAPSAQLCGDRAAREVARFFSAPARGLSPRGVQQAEEEIGACAAFRHSAALPLVAWLRAREARVASLPRRRPRN